MNEPSEPVDEPREVEVEPEAAGTRLDQWLARRFPDLSRTRVQGWIRDGRVLVDGGSARASQPVAAGQRVSVRIPPPPPAVLVPEAIPLNLLFEDEHVLVVMKPAGLQVHPGAGPPRPTLAHALLHRLPGWEAPGPPERPGILHRLDRDTSGLLVVAVSALAYRVLAQQIMARQVTRRYVALVWGHPPLDSGRLEGPIGRDRRDRRRMAVDPSGRPARTDWRVLRRFDSLSLLDIVLGTGRTHQIRVHLSHIGHPVFGDGAYGGTKSALARAAAGERPALVRRLRRLNRQALHAYHLAFRHPADGRRMRFEAPPPADMSAVLEELASDADR